MPAGHLAQRLLLHPAGAGAHGRRAARADRRRAAAAASSRAALAWVDAARRSARRWCRCCRSPTTHVEVAHGLLAVDRFALFFKVVFLLAAAHHRADVGALPRDRGRAARRVLLPDPVRDARHDDHGRRHRSHHHLHRPRDDGGVVLHPGRLHQAEPAVERGGGQVLPARRVLARHPAVRHVAAVRPVGHDATCASMATAFAGQERDPRLRARGHPGRRRHRLQDRRGAVPHVGARRLRRGADADHRVPVGRLEGGVVRDAAADLPRGAAVDERRLAAAVRGAGDRHDDGRQRRRADADEHQADARVLVDRARRLPADRRRRRHAARRHGDADLPAGLRVHAARRVRGRRHAAARATSSATS